MKRVSLVAFFWVLMGLVGSAWGQSPLCPKGKTVLVPYVDALVIPVVPKPNHCVVDVTDSDNDGMADSWELAWFGDLEAANGLGMMTDVDEDGISDLEEYERGGNPTVNDASAFIAANRCQQRYLPFGDNFNSDDCGQIKHAGRVHDRGTGLHYNRARYYDAAVGQFLSPDPVGPVDYQTGQVNLALLQNPQRLNPYAYALNNPYRYEDPSGEIVTDILDVGFFALSLAAFSEDPSLLTGLDVVLDGAGLLPFVPGLGTVRRVGSEAISKGLKVSPNRATGLRKVQDRLDFRGDPNSIIQGSDVARKEGGKRAFITDKDGRIIKEITPQRIKIRETNALPDGTVRETFSKFGKPTAEDLDILDQL